MPKYFGKGTTGARDSKRPAEAAAADQAPPERRRRKIPRTQFAITVDLDLEQALRVKIRREFIEYMQTCYPLLEYVCVRKRGEMSAQATLMMVLADGDDFLVPLRRKMEMLPAAAASTQQGQPPASLVRQVLDETGLDSVPRYYLHCYLQLRQRTVLDDVRATVAVWAKALGIDVKPCSDRDKWLRYLCKWDGLPYTNLCTSELGFIQEACRWVCSRREFHIDDMFVVCNYKRYKFLEELHGAYSNWRLIRGFAGLRPVTEYYPPAESWTGQCAKWWNDSHATFRQKRSCLFVWGPSDVGKTTWIRRMIGGDKVEPFTFLPGVGRFFMSSFVPARHKVILFEEFDETNFNIRLLKRLVEGEMCAFPVKRKRDLHLQFQGPIIFVSTQSDVLRLAGVRNRLHVVHADTPYWLREAEGMVALDPIVVGDASTSHRVDAGGEAATVARPSTRSTTKMRLKSSYSPPPSAIPAPPQPFNTNTSSLPRPTGASMSHFPQSQSSELYRLQRALAQALFVGIEGSTSAGGYRRKCTFDDYKRIIDRVLSDTSAGTPGTSSATD